MNKKQNSLLRICLIGVFSALSIVLAILIHVPLIPAVSFLEYDPADIPIFFLAAYLGPGAGLLMTALVSLIQGLTVSAASGWIGIVMHFLATGSFVAAETLLLRFLRRRTGKETISMALSILSGVVAMTVVMALWNLIFTPYFMHMPLPDFLPFLPYIVLFNILKATLNGAAAFILWRVLRTPIAKYISPT